MNSEIFYKFMQLETNIPFFWRVNEAFQEPETEIIENLGLICIHFCMLVFTVQYTCIINAGI